MTEEHRRAVQTVILGCYDVRLPMTIPVVGSVEDRLEKITIGLIVRPLTLPLEARQNCVSSQSLFPKAKFGQVRIAPHHITRYHRHLDNGFPIAILLFSSALFFRRVVFSSLFTVFLDPDHSALEFFGIIDTLVNTPEKFSHVYCFHAHAKIRFEEVVIYDRSSNAHGNCPEGNIGFATHRSNCYTSS